MHCLMNLNSKMYKFQQARERRKKNTKPAKPDSKNKFLENCIFSMLIYFTLMRQNEPK